MFISLRKMEIKITRKLNNECRSSATYTYAIHTYMRYYNYTHTCYNRAVCYGIRLIYCTIEQSRKSMTEQIERERIMQHASDNNKFVDIIRKILVNS